MALLAGGVYSSIDLDTPVAEAIKKAHVENMASPMSSNVALQKPATFTPPVAPLPVVPVLAASSPVVTSVQATAPVPASQPQVAANASPAVVPQPATQQVQLVQATRPSPVVPVQPLTAATKPIVDPIMPVASATPATVAVSGANGQTPVVVAVPTVAKVVVADESSAQPMAATQSSSKPVHTEIASAPQPTVKAASVQAAKRKKKHRVARTEEDDGSQAAEAPVKEAAPATPKGDQSQSEYTEIKGAATPQTFAAPVAAQAAPTVRKQVDDSFRPTVVAVAGGQAWVKISPERTVAVKSGDKVPGLGTVTSVTGNSVETDKGKFSLNTKE